MKELTDIVAVWDEACAEGRDAVLATVVGVSGSTYRRPGARMLFSTDGRLAGSVSGGCLEGDLLKKAWWRTQNGPALVTYDSTDEEDMVWGFGLGCNGVVRVLLERISPAAPGPLHLLSAVLRERKPGVIATVVAGHESVPVGERLLLLPDGRVESGIANAALAVAIETDARAALAEGCSRTTTYKMFGGSVSVFIETVLPPAPLVIFGANFDAGPLVRMAKELGWHVTVVDTRAARARPERFPLADSVIACSAERAGQNVPLTARTAAVVMTHNYPDDRRVLQLLLASEAGYIGQLGPRARTERLLAELRDDGVSITDSHRSRLHGPVGLDLGADNPEEIALSIAAEVQAWHVGRAGGSLRACSAPLHPRAAAFLFVPEQPSEPAACMAVA